MRALGFSPAAIKQAIKLGDRDDGGYRSTNSSRSSRSRAASAATTPTPTPSIALVANSHRLTTLVDSYNPAVLAAADAKNDRRARAARAGAGRAEPTTARAARVVRVAAGRRRRRGVREAQPQAARRNVVDEARASGADAPLALPRVSGAAPAHPIDGMWLLSRNSVVAAVLSGAGA